MCPSPSGLHGFCDTCDTVHHLSAGNSRHYCLQLMQWLEQEKTLDYLGSDPNNPAYSTATLFGDGGGKMFGVLEGLNSNGDTTVLHSFSGQFNGCWNIPGWVPPLFKETLWHCTTTDTEQAIKAIGRKIDTLPPDSTISADLKRQRRILSQDLMTELHLLYLLKNFRGKSAPLRPFFSDKQGIPTGTGDCCAPKLLQYALQHNIIPVGISEFYWGRENRSGSRKHQSFYPACVEKCQPLIGFMLCGLDDAVNRAAFYR